MLNNYYVYKHIDEDGVVVYVGKGRYDRAWSVYRSNLDHVNWLKLQLPNLKVLIWMSNLSETDALIEETRLIKEIQPKFNSFHTKKDTHRLLNQGKWLAKNKSRFNESDLQTELGKRAAKSPKHPNNTLFECIHCRAKMNLGHIKRYHNDNCKRRVSTNDTN
jgi:excinuclease UvrABC nuclease subunit